MLKIIKKLKILINKKGKFKLPLINYSNISVSYNNFPPRDWNF